MTPPLSDRLKDVQRQYVAMDQHLAAIQNAAQGVVHNCAELANKCREEVHVREQVIEGLQYERRKLLSLTVLAGAAGAVLASLAGEVARWLWETFLAILSFGWNALTG